MVAKVCAYWSRYFQLIGGWLLSFFVFGYEVDVFFFEMTVHGLVNWVAGESFSLHEGYIPPCLLTQNHVFIEMCDIHLCAGQYFFEVSSKTKNVIICQQRFFLLHMSSCKFVLPLNRNDSWSTFCQMVICQRIMLSLWPPRLGLANQSIAVYRQTAKRSKVASEGWKKNWDVFLQWPEINRLLAL